MFALVWGVVTALALISLGRAAVRSDLVRRLHATLRPPPPQTPAEHACTICCTRPIQRVFQPCMHACACDECARRLEVCPVCRSQVVAKWRVYVVT